MNCLEQGRERGPGMSLGETLQIDFKSWAKVVTVGILSGIAEGKAGGVALKLESSGKPKAAKAKVQNRVHRQAG